MQFKLLCKQLHSRTVSFDWAYGEVFNDIQVGGKIALNENTKIYHEMLS